MNLLELFEPFGNENENELFFSALPVKQAYTMGQDDKHLNIYLNTARKMRAIGWNMGGDISKIACKKFFECFFYLETNEFRGEKSIQLKIKK